MTSDLDIYRSARLLIDRHGDEAATRAAERADRLSDAGDLDGASAMEILAHHRQRIR